MKDYYKILKVEINATSKMIKDQWLFLLQAWHPDKFRNKDQKLKAEHITKGINEAYSVISDPIKRKKYDDTYKYNTNNNVTESNNYSVHYNKGKKGKYLEVKLIEVSKNRILKCDPHCVWFEEPDRCRNKNEFYLTNTFKDKLIFTGVLLSIKNIFRYELHIQFERNCFLIDTDRNVYKRKFLYCDTFSKFSRRYLTQNEWLQPNTKASFLITFPEIEKECTLSEISFELNLFEKGTQFGWVKDTEVYNLRL